MSDSSHKRTHLRYPHRHRHHQHRTHHNIQDSGLSGLLPPTSFGEFLKQAKSSHGSTPSHSRRGSVIVERLDGQNDGMVGTESGAIQEPLNPITHEDVDEEREKAKAHEEELQQSLQILSGQAMKTSRRLDETYYFLLEKQSLLRQTIGNLQELAKLMRSLGDDMQSDTDQLFESIKGQIEGFDGFDAQQTQVTALEERIKNGKNKADSLTARLADVKMKVEQRVQSEEIIEARKTRRLRYLWSIIVGCLAVVLLATVFQQLKPVHLLPDAHNNFALASKAQIMEASIPDIAKEAIMGSRTAGSMPVMALTDRSADDYKGDARLRMFDEL